MTRRVGPVAHVFVDTTRQRAVAFVSVTVTGSAAAGTNPAPSPTFFSTNTVNVCG